MQDTTFEGLKRIARHTFEQAGILPGVFLIKRGDELVAVNGNCATVLDKMIVEAALVTAAADPETKYIAQITEAWIATEKVDGPMTPAKRRALEMMPPPSERPDRREAVLVFLNRPDGSQHFATAEIERDAAGNPSLLEWNEGGEEFEGRFANFFRKAAERVGASN